MTRPGYRTLVPRPRITSPRPAPFQMPSDADLERFLTPELKRLDIRTEILVKSAQRARATGRAVTITSNGQAVARFHPDGRTEILWS